MPSLSGAASGAGFTRGFRVGLESARQRRIEEEERKRQREREDFDMEQARLEAERRGELHPLDVESRRLAIDTAREEAGRRKELHPIDVESRRASLESARYGLERQKVVDAREDELYPIEREKQRLSLASARRAYEQEPEDRRRRMEREDFDFSRKKVDAARTDRDRADADAAAAAEHFPYLFAGIEDGIDPNLLLRRFNEQSPRKLAGIDYDRATGMVTLEDDEGEVVSHPLEQWRKAYPLPERELQKLGKDDRLVDPKTGRTVVGPASETSSGRDISPYNPQTVQDDIDQGIKSRMGGPRDPYGRYQLETEEDRQLGGYRIALAQQLAGQLEPELISTRITPAKIIDMVMEATKDVPSDRRLQQMAEEWRTQGLNKTPEQAREWFEAERAKVHAEAERKLAEAVQRFLGSSAAAPAVAPRAEKPSWAGAEVQGVSPEGFDPAYEYDVDIDGRRTTIRVGPDGRVYEVNKGQPQARSGKSKARSENTDPVRLALADARRNSEFVY